MAVCGDTIRFNWILFANGDACFAPGYCLNWSLVNPVVEMWQNKIGKVWLGKLTSLPPYLLLLLFPRLKLVCELFSSMWDAGLFGEKPQVLYSLNLSLCVFPKIHLSVTDMTDSFSYFLPEEVHSLHVIVGHCWSFKIDLKKISSLFLCCRTLKSKRDVYVSHLNRIYRNNLDKVNYKLSYFFIYIYLKLKCL